MTTTKRWTVQEAEALPDDGKMYEIIDGELEEMKAPDPNHEKVVVKLARFLDVWSSQTNIGSVTGSAGFVFDDENGVIPDMTWMTDGRQNATFRIADRKFHGAPELAIEVLSPGAKNEKRDKQDKLSLYSRRGVSEYWIVDWRKRTVEIYRRTSPTNELGLVVTLDQSGTITSPILPGFSCTVSDLFINLLPG